MKPTFDNGLVASFVQYIDYRVQTKGTAFTNTAVTFYPSSSRLTGYAVYASPYKAFNADASVTGSWVPSGISGAGGAIVRGTSGLKIDFDNGRVLFSGSASGLTNLSGGFAVKDFNVQYETMNEESLLFDTKFVLSNPATPQTLTGLKENERTYPSIFVKFIPGTNKPAALGGMEESRNEFRCIVVSDTKFKFDAVNGILRDLARTNFGLLAPQETPFNYFGDIKSGDQYNYTGLAFVKTGPDLMLIDNVYVSPLNEKLASELNPKAHISLVDFEVKPRRYTRQ